MRVVGIFRIPGRGVVVHVEDPPKSGLMLGVLVHQGKHAWKIVGLERSHSALGLRLKAEEGCPDAPEEGVLEL